MGTAWGAVIGEHTPKGRDKGRKLGEWEKLFAVIPGGQAGRELVFTASQDTYTAKANKERGNNLLGKQHLNLCLGGDNCYILRGVIEWNLVQIE